MKRRKMAARGSLLILSLWIVAILGALAVATAKFLSLEVQLTKYHSAREQARMMAHSGVLLAMQRLMVDAQQSDKPYDWLGETWASVPASFGSESDTWTVSQSIDQDPAAAAAVVNIRITDEERKLDINRLEDPTGEQMFVTLIGSSDQVDLLADYVDTNTEPRPSGLESLESEPPYRAKNGPMATMAELFEIPGMREDTIADLQRQATVYLASSTKVNINTASRDVLRAVGLTSLADTIVGFRDQGHYFTALTPQVATESPAVPVPFDATETEFMNMLPFLDVHSQTFLIRAEGVVAKPSVHYTVEAVVRRSGCGEGIPEPCVVAWKE